MKQVNCLEDLVQARSQLRDLCDNERFAASNMFLIGSGSHAATHPGLWEYLARQSLGKSKDVIAHQAREALWDVGRRSTDVALHEAEYFLGQGNWKSAMYVVENKFGMVPDSRRATQMLIRCVLAQTAASPALAKERPQRKRALKLDEGFRPTTPAEAMSIIDLLRFSGALDQAMRRNEQALQDFAGRPQFVLRKARILEQRRDPAGAIEIWNQVSGDFPEHRIEALFKLEQLHTFIGEDAQAGTVAARLALEPLSLPDRMRLACSLGQRKMINELAKIAAFGGQNGQRLSNTEGRQLTDHLIENGDIGLVVWLRRQRIAVSDGVKAALELTGFDMNGTQPLPDTIDEAASLRSPDFMLPLAKYLNHAAKPKGWPGRRERTGRVLLVNGTLGGGGAERQFVELVRALIAAGSDPDDIHCGFFSLEADRGFAKFLPDLQKLGVAVYDMQASRIVNRNLPRSVETVLSVLPRELRDDAANLWHLVEEVGPVTIHGWQDRSGLAAGIVGDLADIDRVIMSARNLSPQSRHDKRLMSYHALYRDFLAHDNYVMTANASVATKDYATWLDVRPTKLKMLQNGIDLERFSSDLRRARAEADQPVRVGGIFRLAANKRPLFWLEIVAALQARMSVPIVPVLRGSGPMRKDVEDRARDLGFENFEIQGNLSDPKDIYGDLDIVLLTSRVEGIPNALIEAQCVGLPVAACDVGGVAEAVLQTGRSKGLLFAADPDIQETADQLAEWLPNALTAPSKARRAFVANKFGPQILARTARSLYLGEEEAVR